MLYDLKTPSKKRKRVALKEFLPFSLLFLLLILNLFNSPPSWKKEILQKPKNPQTHLQLGKIYLENNDLSNAKKEALLALNLGGKEAENLLKEIEKKEKEREEIQKEIKKWQKILETHPNYRDAYLQIALLNWKIFRKKEALEALNKALELDPNFAPAKKLKKILSD